MDQAQRLKAIRDLIAQDKAYFGKETRKRAVFTDVREAIEHAKSHPHDEIIIVPED